MGVAHGCRRLGVPEQTTYQFKRQARRHQMARERVAKVVDTDVLKFCFAAYLRPEAFEVLEWFAGLVAGKKVTATLPSRADRILLLPTSEW